MESPIVSPKSPLMKTCGKTLTALDIVPIFSFAFPREGAGIVGLGFLFFMPMEIIAGSLLVLNFKLTSSIFGIYPFVNRKFSCLGYCPYRFKDYGIFSYQVYILLGLGLLYRAVCRFLMRLQEIFLIFSLVYLILYLGFKDSLGDGDYYYYLGLSLFLKSSSLLYFILISIWLGAIGGILRL